MLRRSACWRLSEVNERAGPSVLVLLSSKPAGPGGSGPPTLSRASVVGLSPTLRRFYLCVVLSMKRSARRAAPRLQG